MKFVMGVPFAAVMLFIPAINASLFGCATRVTPDELQGRVSAAMTMAFTGLASLARTDLGRISRQQLQWSGSGADVRWDLRARGRHGCGVARHASADAGSGGRRSVWAAFRRGLREGVVQRLPPMGSSDPLGSVWHGRLPPAKVPLAFKGPSGLTGASSVGPDNLKVQERRGR